MNTQLEHLCSLSDKPVRRVIGLMSGTSLDGLDIAYCECSNHGLKVQHFTTIPYDAKLRSLLVSVQSKDVVPLGSLCILHTKLAHKYASFIRKALNEWGLSIDDVDVIGSHGQTVYHYPTKEQTSTLQIVDGDQLAVAMGVPVLSDFRQKHTAVGGEGAPLVVLMEQELFQHDRIDRVLINLGGIANVTVLPARNRKSPIVSTDTGPANTLINEAMSLYFGKDFDDQGRIATQGRVHEEFVKALLQDDFFTRPFPKSTGQELFNLGYIQHHMDSLGVELSPKDLVATLTKFTVESVAKAINELTSGAVFEWYVSGGGRYNEFIMDGLRGALADHALCDFEDFDMPSDAKEAALIAFLADALLTGKTFEVASKQVSLGKISLAH